MKKYCLFGCAGIMLIGFATVNAASCPKNETVINIGSNNNYDNCNIQATSILIGGNNSFENATLRATSIEIEGKDNNFTDAKLYATSLDDKYKLNNPRAHCVGKSRIVRYGMENDGARCTDPEGRMGMREEGERTRMGMREEGERTRMGMSEEGCYVMKVCDDCRSNNQQIWKNTKFRGTTTNFYPIPDGLNVHVTSVETSCRYKVTAAEGE